MFADLPREGAGGVFLVRGLACRRDLQRTQVRQHTQIAILHDQPADEFFEVESHLLHLRERTDIKQPQILFALQFSQGILGKPRGNDDLDEGRGDFLGGGQIDRPVERQDAAERRDRIRRPRLHIGFDGRRAQRHTAGIVVLDNGDRALVIFFRQFEGRIRVEEVVVRHRLPVQNLPARHRRLIGVEFAIERALLVRILSVPQRLRQLELHRKDLGKLYGSLLPALHLFFEIARNQAVIARRMLKHFHGQLAT